MLLQAAGFAVLAALSPTALLITAIYLGSARPRTTALCYLAGAVLISTIMGIAVLLLLRYGNFQLPGHRTPRYGLRLGLGLLILAAIAVVARRKPRLPGLSGQPRRPGPGSSAVPDHRLAPLAVRVHVQFSLLRARPEQRGTILRVNQ